MILWLLYYIILYLYINMGIIPYINEYIYILYHDPIFENILTYLYGCYINEYIYIYIYIWCGFYWFHHQRFFYLKGNHFLLDFLSSGISHLWFRCVILIGKIWENDDKVMVFGVKMDLFFFGLQELGLQVTLSAVILLVLQCYRCHI